jgi:predicted NAD/FAD-dependent oxidoreductase
MSIDTEVIVIGSGIGGLSCAAMLAYYEFEVLVCKSHSIPGGAAHSFQRNGYRFDSGSSLYLKRISNGFTMMRGATVFPREIFQPKLVQNHFVRFWQTYAAMKSFKNGKISKQ